MTGSTGFQRVLHNFGVELEVITAAPRNTSINTLGELMASADDDMRPYSLMEHSPESLEPDEVCRGRHHRAGENGYGRKSFDILTASRDVLGKPTAEVPEHYDRGELLVDTAMDLETNATQRRGSFSSAKSRRP